MEHACQHKAKPRLKGGHCVAQRHRLWFRANPGQDSPGTTAPSGIATASTPESCPWRNTRRGVAWGRTGLSPAAQCVCAAAPAPSLDNVAPKARCATRACRVLGLLRQGQELLAQCLRRLQLGAYEIIIPQSTQHGENLVRIFPGVHKGVAHGGRFVPLQELLPFVASSDTPRASACLLLVDALKGLDQWFGQLQPLSEMMMLSTWAGALDGALPALWPIANRLSNEPGFRTVMRQKSGVPQPSLETRLKRLGNTLMVLLPCAF